MSMHDPDRVQKIRDDIERRSGEGQSQSAEELAEDAKAKHRAAQQSAGFDVVAPQPETIWEPPVGGKVVEGQFSDPAPLFQKNEKRTKDAHILESTSFTGEPIFIFRAKDFFSIQVLTHYANLVEQYGPDDAQFHNDIIDAIGEFKEWQKAHVAQVRYPD